MLNATKPSGVALIFLILALLFGMTDSLTRAYRAERLHRAEACYRRGQDLAHAGQPAQAVEEYRAALAFAHNDSRYQLALALSLFHLGRLNEAESHLLDLHEADPNNAYIDLLLARIASRRGRTEEAVTDYHQAIYGLWPDDPARNRVQARFELVDLLARAGRPRQALAELLSLADEAPDDPAVENRIAGLLLRYGSPQRAGEMFRNVLENDPRNPDAAFGAAEAAFAQADYAAAEAWFRRALRLHPDNGEARRRLEECSDILALDPTGVKISAGVRYQRSRALVEKTLGSLEACTTGRALPADTQALISSAQEILQPKRRHREGDTPNAIALAERLWQVRSRLCGRSPASEEVLDLVMAKVGR